MQVRTLYENVLLYIWWYSRGFNFREFREEDVFANYKVKYYKYFAEIIIIA